MAAQNLGRRFVTAMLDKESGWKTSHFWGPVANWGISIAAVVDITTKGPDVISLPMTCSLSLYSILFMRFAWLVQPRNYILFACHGFNEVVQITQLGRKLKYDSEQNPEQFERSKKQIAMFAPVVAGATGGAGMLQRLCFPGIVPKIQQNVMNMPLPKKAKDLLGHPAGPFTVFFWAPTWKWSLSVSNLADYNRPIEKVSYPQQLALMSTGLIWMRWSMVINPVNYNLCVCNGALFASSGYHVMRKMTAGGNSAAAPAQK